MSSRKGKAQFYVFYLGWKECRGVRGRHFVEPIVRELISRRLNEDLPKLTIEATRKELKIMQLIEKRKGKIEKLKYPAIPTKDVTYAVQALSPDEDVVACIYLGYNPQTHAAVHVHVYRCDSPATASFFVDHLEGFISLPDHQERINKIEAELVAKGQVYPAAPFQQYQQQQQQQYRDGYPAADGAANSRYDLDPREDLYNSYVERRNFAGASRENYNIRESARHVEPHDYRDPPAQQDPYNLVEFRRHLAEQQQQEHLSSLSSVSNGGPPPGHSIFNPRQEAVNPYHEQEEVYQSVAAELKEKLQGRGSEKGPLLLPAKDYNTEGRKTGTLDGIEEWRARNKQHLSVAAGLTEDKDTDDIQGFNKPYNEVSYQRWKENGLSQDTDYQSSQPRSSNVRRARSPEGRRARSPEGERRRGRSPDGRYPYGHPARAASPDFRGRYNEDAPGRRRGRSPTRGQPEDSRLARALSPPPGHELRNNYFPNNDMLPNYLAPSSDYGYSPRAVSPSRRSGSPPRRALSPARRGGSPPHLRHSGGADDGGWRKPRNPKYTATRLGLNQGRAQGHPTGRPRSDEGYLSMDRQNNQRGEKEPYGDAGYPRDDSPPPREVIAGDMPHRELIQDVDPNLPGSTQSFLY